MSNKGLRYNQGKNRLSLVPTSAIEGIGEVLTYGANKYTVRDDKGNVLIDGANNWRKGLPWLEVIDSLERHLAAFKKGEDNDVESNLLHIDHLLTNAAFLKEFYKIYPQGDNRLHPYLNTKRIGLDIDEVLADFIGHWTKHHGQEIPETWNFDRNIKQKFESLKDDKNFWMSVPVLTKPQNIPFEPTCYITSRWIDNSWTEEWLDKHGFPQRPVFSVKNGSKVDVAKEQKLDLFVDDRFENFVEMNNAGICCYLFDAPHNQRYNVGYKRIKDLNDIL